MIGSLSHLVRAAAWGDPGRTEQSPASYSTPSPSIMPQKAAPPI